MPGRKWSYDPECEKLAKHFLDSRGREPTDLDIKLLSQAIQNTVEDTLSRWEGEEDAGAGDDKET